MADETNSPREVKTPSGRHIINVDQWVARVEQTFAEQKSRDPAYSESPEGVKRDESRERMHQDSCERMNYCSDGGGNFVAYCWYSIVEFFTRRKHFIPSLR